jgi:hypothetical protein
MGSDSILGDPVGVIVTRGPAECRPRNPRRRTTHDTPYIVHFIIFGTLFVPLGVTTR